MLWRTCHHPHPEGDDHAHHSNPISGITGPVAARTLAPFMARSLVRSYIPPHAAAPPRPTPPRPRRSSAR